MFYLFDLKNYTDEEYQKDLAAVPADRREKALSYRFIEDRKRSVKAFMLLKEGLMLEYGMETVPDLIIGPYGKPELCAGKSGKPESEGQCLENQDDEKHCCEAIYFSLSHSKDQVLCVIDREPVGADVEGNIEDMDLAPQVLDEDELEQVSTATNPANEFAACWTAKESVLKLEGLGLQDFNQVKAIPSRSDARYVIETVRDERGGFAYSTARYRKPGDCGKLQG